MNESDVVRHKLVQHIVRAYKQYEDEKEPHRAGPRYGQG